jgi:hypothetical protein
MSILNKNSSVRLVLILVFSIFSNTVVADNSVTIKLEKHFKVESTFSGEFSTENGTSFHLILTENSKTEKYDTFIYLFDGNNATKIGVISETHVHGINTFYRNGDVLTIITSYKKKGDLFIKRIDVDVDTSTIKEYEPISNENFYTSLRTKNSVYFVYKNKKEFKLLFFDKENEVKKRTYVYRKMHDSIRAYFRDTYVTAIKTDEFVANGAVSKTKLYLIEDHLVFTKRTGKRIKGLRFNLNSDVLKPVFQTYKNSKGKEFKKNVSYSAKNRLYLLGLSKNKGTIVIYNSENGKKMHSIELNDSLLHKSVTGKEYFTIQEFLYQASKGRHNATITVNEAEKNRHIIRIDYVNVNYSYTYNWWWHHNWMFQQQQMHMNIMMNQMSIPSGFGPAQPEEYYLNSYKKKKEKVYIEFTIDENGIVQNEVSKPIYKEIDKEKYIDKLADISNFKFESSCFLKNEFRYAYYNTFFNTINIQRSKTE